MKVESAPKRISRDPGKNKPKILVVDDRKENLVALGLILKDADAQLVEVTSGNDALTATLDHDFALAILDVQMPKMDGYELAGLLRSEPRTSRMPIIFLTAAYGDEQQVFKGYEAGAVDYIIKPYNPMILLSKVKVFLELKLLQEDLVNNAYELTNAYKELESFSYSVSHDLLAPLRSISGFAETLLDDFSSTLDTAGLDYIKRIVGGAKKMGELIDDLLDLSRISRLEMKLKEVDLSALAAEIIHELKQTEPQRNVEIIIENGIRAHGDKSLLKIALSNLLGNSWKYTGCSPHSRIEFNILKKANRVVYRIRDNGAGFDMKYCDKLFQPFQRLHSNEQFSGTGIGLAMVKRIIQRHGGEIWAAGEPGKGATFNFTLKD